MLVDELTFQRKALQREYRRRHKDAMESTMTTNVTENQVNECIDQESVGVIKF